MHEQDSRSHPVREDMRLQSAIWAGERVPTIVVENGHVLSGRLRRARITEEEVLESARRRHGLETIADIKYAILEASGEISIIPWRRIGEDAGAAGAQ